MSGKMNVTLGECFKKSETHKEKCSSFYKYYQEKRSSFTTTEEFVKSRLQYLMKKSSSKAIIDDEPGPCGCCDLCESNPRLEAVRCAARARLSELELSASGCVPSCSTTLAPYMESILSLTNSSLYRTEIINSSLPETAHINDSMCLLEDIVPHWDDSLPSEDDVAVHELNLSSSPQLSSDILKYLYSKLPKDKAKKLAMIASDANNQTKTNINPASDFERKINTTFEKSPEFDPANTEDVKRKINTTFEMSPEFDHAKTEEAETKINTTFDKLPNNSEEAADAATKINTTYDKSSNHRPDEAESQAIEEVKVDDLGLPNLLVPHTPRSYHLSPSPDTIRHYRRVRERSLSRISTGQNETDAETTVSTTSDTIPDSSVDHPVNTMKINTTFDKLTEVVVEKAVKNLNLAMPLKKSDLNIKKAVSQPKKTGPMKATATLCKVAPPEKETAKPAEADKQRSRPRRSRSLTSPYKDSISEDKIAPIATSTPTKDDGILSSLVKPSKSFLANNADVSQIIPTDSITSFEQPTLRKSRSTSALRVSHKVNQMRIPVPPGSKLPSRLPSKSKVPQRELPGKENIHTKRF